MSDGSKLSYFEPTMPGNQNANGTRVDLEQMRRPTADSGEEMQDRIPGLNRL